VKARVVWTSPQEFEVVPQLSAADMLRFMATPEYAAALRIWRERNETVSQKGPEVVMRPAGALLEDIENGGPVDPAKSSHYQ
jgi:hypothetical protein